MFGLGLHVCQEITYKRQVNLEREYRNCRKSRRDKNGITRHIMMHQVLYIVQLPNEEDDLYIIQHFVHRDMPCDLNLVSSAQFLHIFPF